MPTLFSVFEDTVRRFGTRVAVEVQRKDALDRFTYDDLHALALDRAACLDAAGVRPGDRCAILAPNDAHWCAAYLAILSRGAIVVPFDTNYSAEQVGILMRDSGARVLFVGERLRSTAEQALAELPGVRTLDVHAEPRAAAGGAPAPCAPGPTLDPSAPAVILYTSGTTSDPKGVVLSHANLIAERDAAFAVVDVGEHDSVLGVLPLFHSLAQLANLLLPFAVGARVVYLETLSSQELVRALSERQITIFACVPQFFYLIHERILREVGKRGWAARTVFRALLSTSFRARRLGVNLGPTFFGKVHQLMGRQMRLFVTGGSKFDPAIGRDLYALGFTILQAYGLTETSGAATINTPHEAHIDTVGRPLPGVDVRILPPEAGGEAGDGEIAIRGPIVMQGYYGRPDATAAVMRDGWFLTGDLGRMDREGRVTITGRKKEVIILANGKNLYPEEIEAHYRKSVFVKEICVTTLAGGAGPVDERLYAVVVPDMDVLREKKIVNAGDLLRFELEGMGASLPSYKRVLGYEVSFDPLPRTTTGKLKRHEILRRLKQAPHHGAPAGEATPDDVAWLEDPHVAAAMAVVRRRAAEGISCRPASNLELDLGLDSMERVELLTELEQQFGVDVPEEQVHHIFTLGQLIDAVRPSHPPQAGPHPTVSTGAYAPKARPEAPAADESWSVLLRELPPVTDSVLGPILSRRPFVEPLLYVGGHLLARALARVEVTGLEKLPREGAFLICPNHQSYLDPFFVCGVLPYRALADAFFIGAIEYFETPLMAWIGRRVNLVPVDPDSNLVPAMKAGAFGLSHGKVLVLFPEGERSIDGTVKRFKKGAPILSRHMGVPVVPVALKGVHELWPRGRALNWRAVLPWRRARVRLQFGDPVQFTDGESYADAANRLRGIVEGMWQKL
ncbi:MAG: AMP-binding protein [Acidobacteria bacterium]|nr:AMP-binding protein [Acidobacteriota bacterium]